MHHLYSIFSRFACQNIQLISSFAQLLSDHELGQRERKRIEANPSTGSGQVVNAPVSRRSTKRQVNALLDFRFKVLFTTAMGLGEKLELAEIKGELKNQINTCSSSTGSSLTN